MLKDKLYKVVHWIGLAPKGLRVDESPQGGLASDKVVTISLREFDDLKDVLKGLVDGKALYDHNFLVNSLDGETGQVITRTEMMRVWAVFTLYMRDIVFPEWEGDPRGKMIEAVVKIVTDIMGTSLLESIAENIQDVLGCDKCKKKDTCAAAQRTKEDCTRESDERFN
jgi:hypothetical protein